MATFPMKRFDPLPVYREWWAEISLCKPSIDSPKEEVDFDEIKFYSVLVGEGYTSFVCGENLRCSGVYFPEYKMVLLAEPVLRERSHVGHELFHVKGATEEDEQTPMFIFCAEGAMIVNHIAY